MFKFCQIRLIYRSSSSRLQHTVFNFPNKKGHDVRPLSTDNSGYDTDTGSGGDGFHQFEMFKKPVEGNRLMSAIIIDNLGNVIEKEFGWKELKDISELPIRDLLRLEEKHDIPQFHILPRNLCTVLCLSHFRALVFANEVMIFNKKGKHVMGLTTKLREELAEYAKHISARYQADKESLVANVEPPHQDRALNERMQEIRMEMPFEFTVFDFCLREMINMYANRVVIMHPLVQNALREYGVDGHHSEASRRLIALFPLRNTLYHFVRVSENIEHGLRVSSLFVPSLPINGLNQSNPYTMVQTLLNDEQHLREMCLTEKQTDQDMLGRPRGLSQNTILSLETMLEAHHQKVTETHQSADQLSRKIALKQETINLQMDAYRNYVMSRSLDIQIAGVGISVGTFIVGAFGMNLQSGIEHLPHSMWIASIISAMVAYTSAWGYLNYVKRMSPVQVQGRRGDNLWKLLDSGTSTILNSSDTTVTEERFRKLCKDITGREPSDSETRVLFDIFDSNGDGKLDVEEALGVLEHSGTMNWETTEESASMFSEAFDLKKEEK